jgi:SAM-dependent MidA family methyltransferase
MPQAFTGIILANEVIDAIPCDLIMYQSGFWYYRNVMVQDGKFAWKAGKPVEHQLLPEPLLSNHFPEGYLTELHTQANAWVRHIVQSLHAGLFLTIDYGFPASEYFHSQRHEGTLIAHHRHHAIQDPFYLPGLCDLTSHVEWTQIANNALAEKASDVFLTNQANYLLDAGIGDIALEIGDPSNPATFLPISNALQKLLSEAEMGELFKVFACSKNLEAILPGHDLEDLPGFRGRNRF